MGLLKCLIISCRGLVLASDHATVSAYWKGLIPFTESLETTEETSQVTLDKSPLMPACSP